MPANPPNRFKKGQSGNPKGRPKLSPELRAVPELTTDELKRTIAKYFRTSVEDLYNVLKDLKLPAIDHVICSAIVNSIEKGDILRAEYLWIRSLGRVKDVVDIEPPQPIIINRLDGSTVELSTKVEDEN